MALHVRSAFNFPTENELPLALYITRPSKKRSPWIKGDKMLHGLGKHNDIDSSFNGLVIFISHQMDNRFLFQLGFFTRCSYFKLKTFHFHALDAHLFGELYATLNSKWSNITTSTFWREVMKWRFLRSNDFWRAASFWKVSLWLVTCDHGNIAVK